MKRLEDNRLCSHTCAFVFLTMLLLQRPAQSQTPSKEDIWKAWREREAGINSLEARWTQKLILSARLLAESSSSPAAPGSEGPNADVVTPEFPCVLTISGNRLRFESEIPHFGKGFRGDLNRSVRTFDGQIRQSFTAMRERTSRSSIGTIVEAAEAKWWNLLECTPLCLTARPSRLPNSSAAGDWWIDDRNVVVEGRPCVELRSRLKDADPQLRFVRVALVDHRPPHVVRRLLELIRDSPAVQLDLHYSEENDPPWMPIAWEHSMFYRDGELRQGAEAELVSLRLNLEVPDETFRIDYPPATIVTDGRRDSKMFIVDTDGRFLPFTSGRGLPSKGQSPLVYVLIVGIVGIAGAAYWWKRSSRSS